MIWNKADIMIWNKEYLRVVKNCSRREKVLSSNDFFSTINSILSGFYIMSDNVFRI